MIKRFFHRYGFGIQSPWAYSLVRNVLFEPLRYYAFDDLRQKYPNLSRKERKRNEQLFRIVNHFKPKAVEIVGNADEATRDYLSPSASHPSPHLVYYIAPSAPVHSVPTNYADGTVIVVDDIRKSNIAVWGQLTNNHQATAIFEMGYRGMIVIDPKRIRQTYTL
ncbi:MAG: hypothetical protein J5720_03725 [Bacteroidaceae bacterium]|nr:hypothetical protein [Bacteroidaceae bacterium]